MPTEVVLVDEFEPTVMEAYLRPVHGAERTALNRNGYADYMWYDRYGEPEQFERKQPGEILSDFNGVEYQLRKELDGVRKTNLVVEGVAYPAPEGGTRLAQLSDNGRTWRPGHRYDKISYSRYEAFLWSLEEAGVVVWRTATLEGTAHAISARVSASRRDGTNVLSRHLKQLPEFHQNPFVMTLMGIKGVNLGPEKAEALIRMFTTPWSLFNASPETISENVPGIGYQTAQKILEAIGRR